MEKSVADVLERTSRPALTKRVLVRCTLDTEERIRKLCAKNPGHTRTGIARAALLIGLTHLEQAEVRNGNAE